MKLTADKKSAEAQAAERRKNWALLAGTCFFFGFTAPLLGLVFAIAFSFDPRESIFGSVSTFLIVISIPLLLLGSHFMDVADRKN